MKFDELDDQMRLYETNGERIFLPAIYLVVRLDGRGFTGLTRKEGFEKPFDVRFRDLMVDTTAYLMSEVGFKVRYGYTQSDEISLLLAFQEVPFERKERKLISVLAGEASAFFSLKLGKAATFDARVCQLPSKELVVDYFRWRNEDAARNALNGWCYWTLRQKQGLSATVASSRLAGKSIAYKNELLFQNGLNFNQDVPNWQKRGVGLYWQSYQKAGFNPKTGQDVTVERNRLYQDLELPMRETYSQFIANFLD